MTPDTKTNASQDEVTYGGYLQLEKILGAQGLRSNPAAHDEMLFIIIHQAFELWFKMMLHEVDAMGPRLERNELYDATRSLKRLNTIISSLDAQVSILETMAPQDFAVFRGLLMPASGFQSAQFRQLEFACGLKDERYLRMFPEGGPEREALHARHESPTVWDAVVALFESRGFPMADPADQQQAVVAVYHDDSHLDLRVFCEELIEFDERFSLWREHHVRMAERMIGGKPGTGYELLERSFGEKGAAPGAPGGPPPAETPKKPGKKSAMGMMGVEYLNSTRNKRFFPVLWSARSLM